MTDTVNTPPAETVTLAEFAAQHGAQPWEMAAYLDLGTDYTDDMVMSPELLALARAAIADETPDTAAESAPRETTVTVTASIPPAIVDMTGEQLGEFVELLSHLTAEHTSVWTLALWIDPMDGGVKLQINGNTWTRAYGTVRR